MPQAYDTEIGEGGLKLSAGQRQRLGLARAIFGTPALLVLDEPNASLDADGEQALIDAIQALKARGTTIVIIAHRTRILTPADKLLLLRDGSIKAFGSVSEVLEMTRGVPREVAREISRAPSRSAPVEAGSSQAVARSQPRFVPPAQIVEPVAAGA